MRFTADQVQLGDIVQGVGLKVTYIDVVAEGQTTLHGDVSVRVANDPETGERRYEVSQGTLSLPDKHMLRVRPSDEHFAQVRDGLLNEAYAALAADADYDAFVAAVVHVAALPKGRKYVVNTDNVREALDAHVEGEITAAALDAIQPPEGGVLILHI